MRARTKSDTIAIILALLGGLLGFLGVGHLYLGRLGRGLALLFGGWETSALGFCFLLAGLASLTPGTGVVLVIIGLLLWAGDIALWLWQALDARSQCRAHHQG